LTGEANFSVDWGSVYEKQRRDALVDSALQIALAVLSIVAAYLVASDGPWQRWGYVVGLTSQPFWFVATWRARQYGILLVAIFYTGAWVQGIANRFSL